MNNTFIPSFKLQHSLGGSLTIVSSIIRVFIFLHRSIVVSLHSEILNTH